MESVSVVKVGGKVLQEKAMLDEFLAQFAQLSGSKILIHGGGVLATELADRLGIPSKLADGRRVTDDEMIDVVVMTYGGLLNRQLVAKLQARSVPAIGLTGADANLILSSKRLPVDGLDFGWVGDPVQVNTTQLSALLNQGLVPVVAPLTHDGQGHMLNTNADTIARFVASELAKSFKVSLTYTFELPGVMQDINDADSLIKKLSVEKYQALKEGEMITSGMLPKMDNAFAALHSGVQEVTLIKYDQIVNLNNLAFDDYTRLF